VNIGRSGNRSVDLGFQTIPELRQIGDFSGSPGRVICSTSDSPHARAFTFLSGKGELLETVYEAGSQPQFKVIGSIRGWDQSGVRCDYISGEFLIGRPSGCNFIWLGARGGELVKVPFPYEMASWVPMTPRRILSIDNVGRLHSLGLVDGKWTQTDYLDEFISPTPYLTCALAERSAYVLAFNGETAQSASVGADGKLGAQAVPGYANSFDTARTVTNRLGLCLALSASGAGRLSGPGKPVEIGPVKPDVDVPIALAPNASVVATVTPDLRLIATSIVAAEVTQTAAAHSPQIGAGPQGMAWTPDGGLLAVSFGDKTWRVYRPFGLSI